MQYIDNDNQPNLSDIHLIPYVINEGETKYFKQLYCPLCHSRLIDAKDSLTTEQYVANNHQYGVPDFRQKCWKCKEIIGIKIKHYN